MITLAGLTPVMVDGDEYWIEADHGDAVRGALQYADTRDDLRYRVKGGQLVVESLHPLHGWYPVMVEKIGESQKGAVN